MCRCPVRIVSVDDRQPGGAAVAGDVRRADAADSRHSPDHTKPTLSGVLVADQQHYSDGGYLMWADALAKFIEP